MNKRFLALSLVFILAVGLFAQVMGNSQYDGYSSPSQSNNLTASKASILNNNEIVVQVNGLMNIVADSYVAVFNIVQIGESVEDADRIMNTRISNFRNRLEASNIRLEDVKVDLISFVPKFDIQTESKLFSKSYNEVPSGYEIQKNISVCYKKSSQLDVIVSSALQSEIYDIVKVDYFIENLDQMRDSLRNKCIEGVVRKIKSYELVGVKLDIFEKNVSEDFVTVYPQARYASYQAFSRPSLSEAKKKQTINEAPKITSRYYNPQNYNVYDIVINPVITEPVVQLSFSVLVKYIRKEKEEKVYNLITPSGEVKQIHGNI